MTFADFYREHCDALRIQALSQHVPGLDHDDVVQEMASCMWLAWQTYDPSKGSFHPYWWSIWLNRRNNITRDAFRMKRPRMVLVDDYSFMDDRSYVQDRGPKPPPGSTLEEGLVWRLLASGEHPSDVQRIVGMGKWRYYALIRRWRTEAVYDMIR